MALLVACGVGGAGMLVAKGVSRELPRDPPIEQTVAGLTRFGHDLYTVAADPAKNTVVSPLSVGYAFGMARAGAGGLTAGQGFGDAYGPALTVPDDAPAMDRLLA